MSFFFIVMKIGYERDNKYLDFFVVDSVSVRVCVWTLSKIKTYKCNTMYYFVS